MKQAIALLILFGILLAYMASYQDELEDRWKIFDAGISATE